MMNKEDLEWEFSDLHFPSNMVEIGSDFCFADRMGIFRFDTQHECLLKIADVPIGNFPEFAGNIHLYKSLLYIFGAGLLWILDLKNNSWLKFKTGISPKIEVSWVEFNNSLFLCHNFFKQVWYWNEQNKTFQIVDQASRIWCDVFNKSFSNVGMRHCGFAYYILGKYRFQLSLWTPKFQFGCLEIENIELSRSAYIDLKSNNLFDCHQLGFFRIFAQLQDIHSLGIFLVEGYVRKERKNGLFRFPIVIARLIREMTCYDVVHIIQVSYMSGKYCKSYIKLNLKDINLTFKEKNKSD